LTLPMNLTSSLKRSFVLIYYYGTIKIVWLFEKLMFEKSGFIWQGINGKIEQTKKTVEAIHGIRAIRVRPTEAWLYTFKPSTPHPGLILDYLYLTTVTMIHFLRDSFLKNHVVKLCRFQKIGKIFSIIFVTNIYVNHKIKRLLKIYCTSLIVLNNRMLCETREITKI
jgi:hypothetical protein